ncbi:MAG: alpha/beta hydrolase family protein [Promethearchaeia archaeon]
MKLQKLFLGKSKLLIIGALMMTSFFILLPNFVYVIRWQQAPFTEDEVVITNVSYKSEATSATGEDLIAGLLFQPSPKFSDETYPAIIACHGFLGGAGKESMNRWSVEVAKRGFIVLSIDLPGHGMSIGEKDILPRNSVEPHIISEGIEYLQGQDFVDGEHIGLMGISYGGATVSLSAGVLGEKVDATISMNGFTNFTHWLIHGILPENDVTFSVNQDTIELQKAGDQKFTPENVKDLLRIYELYRGDDKDLEQLIVPGTTKLDRAFLKKFDAVEYLPNAKNQSVMFIDSQRQGTFDHTNQSMLGYNAVVDAGKEAYYIPVDDNHQLMDDPEYTSDYCIINFFEERLKGADLGEVGVEHGDLIKKYTQRRDIELTYSKVFGFRLLYECIGYFFLSFLPVIGIMLILVYNKKVAKKRAQQEEKIMNLKSKDENFMDFSFGRGSYYKTVLFVLLLYILAYLAIILGSLGFFSPLIMGTLCAAFYLVMFLAMYYVPDQAEVDLWRTKEQARPLIGAFSSEEFAETSKIFDVNALFLFAGLGMGVILISLGGLVVSLVPNVFFMPLEPIFRVMLITGASFLIIGMVTVGLLSIWKYKGHYRKMRNDGKSLFQSLHLVEWSRVNLSKYSIVKSITFGSVFYLGFFFQWNIWTFYMKFPMMMAPHSAYFIFMGLSVLLFFGGVELFVLIFKEKVLKDHIRTRFPASPRKGLYRLILIEILGVMFGLVIYALVGVVAFAPILRFALFGTLNWVLVGFFALIYLLTTILRIFYPDKTQFTVSIFVPLLLFTIVAYFLHI